MFNLGKAGSSARRSLRAGPGVREELTWCPWLGAPGASAARRGRISCCRAGSAPRARGPAPRCLRGEERREEGLSPPALPRQTRLCPPRRAYPCPGCGSDRPTSLHDGFRSGTAPPPPAPPAGGKGVRPRLSPCLPFLSPSLCLWFQGNAAASADPESLPGGLSVRRPLSPPSRDRHCSAALRALPLSLFTNNSTTTSGTPVETGHPRPNSTPWARGIYKHCLQQLPRHQVPLSVSSCITHHAPKPDTTPPWG